MTAVVVALSLAAIGATSVVNGAHRDADPHGPRTLPTAPLPTPPGTTGRVSVGTDGRRVVPAAAG